MINKQSFARVTAFFQKSIIQAAKIFPFSTRSYKCESAIAKPYKLNN